jgi:hypothetical protein
MSPPLLLPALPVSMKKRPSPPPPSSDPCSLSTLGREGQCTLGGEGHVSQEMYRWSRFVPDAGSWRCVRLLVHAWAHVCQKMRARVHVRVCVESAGLCVHACECMRAGVFRAVHAIPASRDQPPWDPMHHDPKSVACISVAYLWQVAHGCFGLAFWRASRRDRNILDPCARTGRCLRPLPANVCLPRSCLPSRSAWACDT